MNVTRTIVSAAILSLLLLAPTPNSEAHTMGNAILWNREISRIFYQRCASCHRDGGTAFSLMDYREVQPHAARIKDAVLSRRMPPWGAVKGLGDFKNEQSGFAHPFLFRNPLRLPAGTTIRGVGGDARLYLLPGKGK